MTKNILFTLVLPALILLSPAALPTIAYAGKINLQEASFTERVSLLENEPAFHLSYSSRSLFRGHFGFGWQAGFEDPKKASEKWKFKYDSLGRLQQANKGVQKLLFHYSPQERRVSKITRRSHVLARFKYESDCLTEIELNSKIYKMKYDSQKNLVLFADGRSTQKISYDKSQDQVLSFKQGPCENRFLYLKLFKPNRLLVKNQSRCGKEKFLSRLYEFSYKTMSSGESVLTHLRLTDHKNKTEVLFDEKTGRALSERKIPLHERLSHEKP